jgi:VWFA-related protein
VDEPRRSQRSHVAARAGLLLVAALGVVSGQEARFRAGIDVVVVDVAAVESSGQPVSGLRVEDFTVTVDGKPRKVLTADFVAYAVADAGRQGTSVPPREPERPAGPPALRPSVEARSVLILVDEPSIDPGLGREATLSAMEFVDRLGPGDRAAFATLPSLPDALEFTSDRVALHRAIDRVVGRPPELASVVRIEVAEAVLIQAGDDQVLTQVVQRECGGDSAAVVGCRTMIQNEAKDLVSRSEFNADRTVQALLRVVGTLKDMEGQKTVILVSGGMASRETTNAFARLEEAFATARVRLYALRVRKMPADASQSSGSVRQLRSRPIDTRLGESLLSLGLERLAQAAGGTVFHVFGSIAGSLGRVTREMSASYRLGVELMPRERDGRPHAISVRVKRPGVEIRTWRKYVVALEPARTLAVDAGSVAPAEVDTVVARASEYVADYQARFAALAAEERTEQTVFARGASGSGAPVRRTLIADYVLARPPDGQGWVPFRDVFEVDGRRVRSGNSRLDPLFALPEPGYDEAAQWSADSSRHDVGPLQRNINLPTLGLIFLDPHHRPRFTFSAAGRETIDRILTVRLAFKEWKRPAFIRWNGHDMPVEGRLWIEPESGRVLRTNIRIASVATDIDVTVTFVREPTLDFRVPGEIKERYQRGDLTLESTARYSKFRRLR